VSVDFLLQTLRSLRAHALRFTLTSLGIAWGALMLTYYQASSRGMETHFRTEIEKTGPRIVWVFPGVVIKNRVGERGARPLELESEDVLRWNAFDAIEDAAPNLQRWSQIVRAEGRTKLLTVYGATPASQRIRRFEVAEGRFLSPLDVERSARVAFLGAEAAQRLFGDGSAVGRTVHVEGQAFRVCGVAVEKGEQMVNMGGRDDRAVLVPYTAVQRWLERDDTVKQAIFAPVERWRSYEAMDRVRESVSLRHGFRPSLETTLSFVNVHDILLIIDRIFFALQFFMLVAGGITLAVGAVSVMNIMLVVVAERTREIGLRKAVGAPSAAIFRAFLAETTLVCFVSGAIGALLGAGLAWLVAHSLDPSRRAMSPPELDPPSIVGLVAALVLVGVLAGVIPAWRAARIPPAEALRSR
jgi:putative ABC transport system permease protein